VRVVPGYRLKYNRNRAALRVFYTTGGDMGRFRTGGLNIGLVLLSIGVLGVMAQACSGTVAGPDISTGEDAADEVTIQWQDPALLPSTVEPGGVVSMTAVVMSGYEPVAGLVVQADILLGGGSLSTQTAVTDADGAATFEWTVGMVPVRAALRVSVEGEAAFVDHVVKVNERAVIAPTPFGGIEAALATAGIEGSTEGLAFDDSGNLWLAVPGNMVRISMDGDATTTIVPVAGDGLEAPLGMAWDYLRGCMWVADKASIRRVTFDEAGEGGITATSHVVTGLNGLVTPNSVAIRDNRYVYFSDSCTGGVYRFEPEADSVTALPVASFSPGTQGGPNGLAFDDSGRLWITSENVALLCPESGVDITVNTGGLYYVDIAGDTIGGLTPRLEGFAMFGDGLAFDADGNLYVIFDHFDGFNLLSSAVWLVPLDAGCNQAGVPRVPIQVECEPVMVASVPVPDGATSPDRLIANMAWGGDAFGSGTVYFSLLAVPLVAAERGAMVAEFDISGRSLLPADLP